MAYLSFIPCGIPTQNRLVFRPFYPQIPTTVEKNYGGGTNPWYQDLEMRPNWYAYPEKKLKKKILSVARKKKKLEETLPYVTSQVVLNTKLADLNKLQDMLSQLMEKHREMLNLHAMQGAAEAEEEAEFMELVIELL